MEIIRNFTLIDLFFIALLLKIAYTSCARGIRIEIFKLCALLISSLFAFHYFSALCQTAGKRIGFLTPENLRLASFLLLLIGSSVVFSIIRRLIYPILKTEELGLSTRWLSLFVGIFRFILLSSIIIFCIYLSPLNQKYYKSSLSYRYFKNIAPVIYIKTANAYKKIIPKAIINEKVKIL